MTHLPKCAMLLSSWADSSRGQAHLCQHEDHLCRKRLMLQCDCAGAFASRNAHLSVNVLFAHQGRQKVWYVVASRTLEYCNFLHTCVSPSRERFLSRYVEPCFICHEQHPLFLLGDACLKKSPVPHFLTVQHLVCHVWTRSLVCSMQGGPHQH